MDEKKDERKEGSESELKIDLTSVNRVPYETPNARTVLGVMTWMILSWSVITYNKLLFISGFPFPVALVSFHLIFATIATRILAFTKYIEPPPIDWNTWFKAVFPIGALSTISLICGNQAYLTLSVSFIQMLKSAVPVILFFESFAFGIQQPWSKFPFIVIISIGVSIAAFKEPHFVLEGFLFQATASIAEASRLIMVQLLLSGQKMDPLTSLYYFAPISASFNFAVLVFNAGFDFIEHIPEAGLIHLIINSMIAFALNVSSVMVIKLTSSQILSLLGIMKDMILAIASSFLFQTPLVGLQIVGYSISVTGLIMFRLPTEKLWASENNSPRQKIEDPIELQKITTR